MITAQNMKPGMAIRHEGQIFRVIAADYHPGQGKMGGATHARLQNLATGSLWEHSFRADLKMEDLAVEKTPMDFLYAQGELFCFMNPETFEQVEIPAELLGDKAKLLQPELRVAVEFLEEQPISVLMPDVLEVRIEETAPPIHQQQDSTWKPATLAGGVEVMVPLFIKTGDFIRLDVQNLKYMDRAKGPNK